jgi:soluble lytic murein transglycosylase-like protein
MRLIYKIILYVAIALAVLSANPKSISIHPSSAFASEGFIEWKPSGEAVEVSINNGIYLSVVDFKIENEIINTVYVEKTKTIEKNEVYRLISFYPEKYGFDTNIALNIGYCESGFNQMAVSSTGCSGVYQFSRGTWASTNFKMGRETDQDDRFDVEKNIEAAIWKLSHEGDGAWRPWSGHCYLNNPLNL